MQACGEVFWYDRECVRREMRGRLKCSANIPVMDSELKDHPAHQGAHGNHAPTMIAGFGPLLRAETGDKLIEVAPGCAEHVQQLLAETLSERDSSLRCRRRSLLPFRRRGGHEGVSLRAACWGRRIIPQATCDAVRVQMRRHDEMRHDITDCPEGTGAGRGPGVLRQCGKVLLQALGLCLDDCDPFCL